MDLDLRLYGSYLLNWLYEVQVPMLLQRQENQRQEKESHRTLLRQMHPRDKRSDDELDYVVGNVFAYDDDPSKDPEQDYVDVGDFLRPLGIDAYGGYQIVTYMQGKDLLKMGYYDLSFDLASGPPGEDTSPPGDERYGKVLITEPGIRTAESNRRSWHNIFPQSAPLPQRLILWLSSQGRSGQPTDLQNFLVSRHASLEGRPLFSARDLQSAVGYLATKGLLDDLSVNPSDYPSGTVRLTEKGLECAVGYNGDVARYLDRSMQSNNTSITVTGSTGTTIATGGSEITQTQAQSADLGALIKFAGFVHQEAAALDLSGDQQAELRAAAVQLRESAQVSQPDRGRLRRLIDGLMRALASAAPTLASQTAIDLGEKAIRALGG